MKNFSDYMGKKEAAEFLGVPPHVLVYWDNRGCLKAFRHPINNSRLYEKRDLLLLLDKLQNSVIIKEKSL
jgi:DNA-binding transcriptional MerR regulator